jgi:toxin FitB
VYLVDTNVISAAAPSHPAPPVLVEWMETHSAALFLSVVTVAEIEDGIAKSRRQGATRRSADLAAWFETILHLYGSRILAFDTSAARIAGTIADRARSQGYAPGLADIVIAATALHRGLTILSRDLKHFEPLGVVVIDPFAILPPI